MMELAAATFFDLAGWDHRRLMADEYPVWTALGDRLRDYLDGWQSWQIEIELAEGVHLLGDRIAVAPGCRIEPGAVLVGPAILGEGVVVRTGAYVREYVIASGGNLIGAHSEVKGSILLAGAKAPHQAYVGDSILGRDVNLGAGTILSNVKNVGREVTFRHHGEVVHTGLRKFGAVLGDGCKTGCNTVLNPGVLLGPRCVTYPNATLRSGVYAPDTLIKVRQQQQTVEMTKLRRSG